MLVVKCPERMDKVREFADSTQQREQFESQLKRLEEIRSNSRVVLYSDYAPHSFYFVIEVEVEVRERECLGCQHRWKARVFRGPTPNISGEVSVNCPECSARSVVSEPVETEWCQCMNGGLLYHGAHDNGGDGGAPTFSVNLISEQGWSIHT